MTQPDDPQPRDRHRFAISVRTRIVTAITTVAALGLCAVGASMYVVERQRILEGIDSRLEANLDSARFVVTQGQPEGGTWASAADALSEIVQRMSPDDNTGAIGIVNGEIRYVPGIELDVDLQYQGKFAEHAARLVTTSDPIVATYAEGSHVWRYLAAPVVLTGSTDTSRVVFVLAYDIEAELAEINEAAATFLFASAIVLVVIAATGTIVATRLLRPLRRMRTTAEQISAQSLSERLPIMGNDDVAELAETMNAMLDRIDRALDSQRQLLSDVGHELKTPITIVRGHLEVMDPTNAEDTVETQNLVIDELDRMGQLVQDLSGAAALHGPAPLQLRSVDVDDLVRAITRKAEAIVGADVSLGSIVHGTAVLDPARITQALLQLAQNGVTHGGGSLIISSEDAGPALIRFIVRDHGPGVPDDAKVEIFGRFFRGADSASRSGSGLGLNIVHMIATAHGGTARVEDAPGGGAAFVIEIPRGSVGSAPVIAEALVIPPKPPLPALTTDTVPLPEHTTAERT